MAKLIYNQIELGYLATHSVTQEPVFSDDGADVMYFRYTVTVTGVVVSYNRGAASPPSPKFPYTGQGETVPPVIPGENAAQAMKRIRHMMLVPRRAFEFRVFPETPTEGEVLLEVPAVDVFTQNAMDCANGPKPQYCNIRRLAGHDTFLVDFQIVLCLADCREPEMLPPPNTEQSAVKAIVSHRWDESVDLDDTARSVKRRSGRLIVRSDMFRSPDHNDLRSLVTPPLDGGFRRVRARYAIQSDGLALSYEFEDHEVYLHPPEPALFAEGHYRVSSPKGGVCYGEVRVHLRGDKKVNKNRLLQTAVAVAVGRLRKARLAIDDPGDAKSWMVTGAVQEQLWDADVDVQLQCILKIVDDRLNSLNINFAGFGEPIDAVVNRGKAREETRKIPGPDEPGWTIADRGTAGLILVSQALRDPCLEMAMLKTGEPGEVELQVVEPGQIGEVRDLTTDDAHVDETEKGAYQDYIITQAHVQSQQTFQLPVADEKAECRFVQVAKPVQQRIVNFSAVKVGAKITLPDPTPADANMVLLSQRIEPAQLELLADGITYRHRINGTYVYGYRDASKAQIVAGVPPWIKNESKDANIDADQFADDIIDPTGWQHSWTFDDTLEDDTILAAGKPSLLAGQVNQ